MSSSLIKILVVEDDLGDQELIKLSMKEQKILNQLTIVGNGQEALDYLESNISDQSKELPDLILLDLNMPIMDGKEFLSIVKGDDKFKHIPVLVLTTSDSEQDILESYNLHANGFIKKPIDLTEFTETLKAVGTFWFGINRFPRGR